MGNVSIQANANFHILKEDICSKNDEKFVSYRRSWNERPKEFNCGDFPLFIDIETTSACNLKCSFCATTYRGKLIEKGFITFDEVRKIIDEGANSGLCGVKFNIRGEPLLHPEIHNFVKYAKDKGLIDVYFNTNGLLLTEEMSEKLIDAGLDRISISFEGYTKDVYEKYRAGSNFEAVLKNIKNLKSVKKKLKAAHPKVRIQTVIFPELKPQADSYKKFWSELADEIAFLDYKEMKDKKRGIAYPWACPQIWQRMAVWWDGTLLPCNHDDDAFLSLGNIKDITIKEAWNSDFLNSVRDKHKNGLAHQILSCDGCYLRDSEIGKIKQST